MTIPLFTCTIRSGNNFLHTIIRHTHSPTTTSRYISLDVHTVLHPLIHKYQTHQSYKQATDPNRVAVLSPDMRRVRARQQEAAHQRALQAEEERKEKVKVERERKRVKSPEEERWDKLGGEGKRLGVGDDGAELRQRR